jgi:hypothetical protein
MAKNVTVSVVTKAQSFPVGTVEESFHFVVSDATGVVFDVVSPSPSATFSAVADGDYTVVVTKNGVSASGSFSITPTEVVIQVPDTLSVQIV